MHPTADTRDVINLRRAARRVMPGVMPLLIMSTLLYYLGLFAIISLLLIVVGYPMYLRDRKARKEKIEAAFSGREPLDEQTFYERYFQARGVPADVTVRVRRILEDELGADLSRLSAEDDFTRNLSFFREYDSLTDVEIVMRIEEEFGVKLTNDEVESAHAVEEIVNLVWGKVQPREA